MELLWTLSSDGVFVWKGWAGDVYDWYYPRLKLAGCGYASPYIAGIL